MEKKHHTDLLWLAGARLGDIVSTFLFLRITQDYSLEANPVGRYLLSHSGFTGIIVFNLIVLAIFWAFYYLMQFRPNFILHTVTLGLACISLIATISNLKTLGEYYQLKHQQLSRTYHALFRQAPVMASDLPKISSSLAVIPVTPTTKMMIQNYIERNIAAEKQQWFNDVIYCESKYNPEALSRTRCKGILQFADNTFYGNGGQNIWSWQEQIDVANRMITKNPNNIYQWECSKIMGY